LRGRLRIPVLEDQRDDPCEERINAQGQSEEKRKTTYFRHEGNPDLFFQKYTREANRDL
jgi:hypothetical protein